MENAKMNNMAVRAVSGAVYVALIVGCVLGGGPWFFGLMALFVVLGMTELQKLLEKDRHVPLFSRLFDVAVALLLLTGFFCFDLAHNDAGLYLCGVSLLYIPGRIMLAVNEKEGSPAKGFLFSLLTMCYVAWPLSLLYVAYISDAEGAYVVLVTFVLIWLNDTGAYLTGMSMGRHKLCERLSPKKTWEGFWGGFAICVAGGCVAAAIIGYTEIMQVVMWGAYAAAVSVVGTFGDLFESLIKRRLGVKDSGNLIPGHGGILDRIDSILAVAPLAALMAFVI